MLALDRPISDPSVARSETSGGSTTSCVVHLLESARRTILQDANQAARYIVEAMVLLRADLDPDRGGDPGTGTLAPSQVSLVLKIMEANLGSRLRIEHFAAATALSPSQFSHAFRRSVGESPCRFLRLRRMALAQKMMLSTERSLADIALECGLSDQSHLTRMFRRLVGVSPGVWRRQRRGASCSTSGRSENI